MRIVIFGLLIVVSLINLSGSLSKINNEVLDNDVVRFKPSVNLEEDFINPPGYAGARA